MRSGTASCAGPEIVAVALVPVLARADRDELRQVVVERAETVVDPGAERRESRRRHVPAGVKLRLRTVVAVGRPHRTHDRQAIDIARDVREPIADLDAALRRASGNRPAADRACCAGCRWRRERRAARGRASSDPACRRTAFRRSSCRAYFVSIGFGSKLSMWLTPPFMKSQMTLFAFGAKCGSPSGGVHCGPFARASRCSIAPSARPVKPMPMSARKVRR